MLSQIADLELGMSGDIARVELFFPQQNSQQGTFACTVSTHKTNFDIFRERRFRVVEQHLIAITLGSVLNLHQHGHQTEILLINNNFARSRQ